MNKVHERIAIVGHQINLDQRRTSAGQRTGTYYINSTTLAGCHNYRIDRHKTFAGMTACDKTSMS